MNDQFMPRLVDLLFACVMYALYKAFRSLDEENYRAVVSKEEKCVPLLQQKGKQVVTLPSVWLCREEDGDSGSSCCSHSSSVCSVASSEPHPARACAERCNNCHCEACNAGFFHYCLEQKQRHGSKGVHDLDVPATIVTLLESLAAR